MLHGPTFRFSGENFWLRKICFIIISLVFVSINIYAQSEAWHNISTLPKGGGSACALDGKIYVIGGSVPGSLNDVAFNMIFNPQTLTWEEKALMPTPRGFLFTCVVNDTIYAIGGGYPTSTNKNEAYDPVTDTWMTKLNMPSPWIGVRGAVANGKIYSIGGNYNAHNCFEYNPVTNTWTEKTPIPTDGGGALSATEYNGLIYTFGGSTYSPWAALSTVYAYDPQADTWTKKRNMPTPRFALKTLLVNGKIYAIGGCQSQSTTLATVEIYDPVTDTWVQGENMPVNLGWLTGAVVNDKIYIIAGSPDFGNTGNYIVWEYDPTVPVELTSFNASANGKEITLNWSTATELNNQGFEIQRRIKDANFTTVGFVKGQGTTTSPQQYSFVDKNLITGKYSYRLKQVDYDGTYEYSNIVEVDWKAFNSFLLEQNYPNPFNPSTTIGYGIETSTNVKITILNTIGEEVAVVLNEEKEPGYHQFEFNASALPSGVYFYQLKAGNCIETMKMVLLQ